MPVRSFSETALCIRLRDSVYARLYLDTEQTLIRARLATNRAFDELAKEAKSAALDIKALLDAALLPSGRRVFETRERRLVTEEGVEVTTREAQCLRKSWPSYDACDQQLNRGDALAKRLVAIEACRTNVEATLERLYDFRHPLLPVELRALQSQMEEAPADVKAQFEHVRPPRFIVPTNARAESEASAPISRDRRHSSTASRAKKARRVSQSRNPSTAYQRGRRLS